MRSALITTRTLVGHLSASYGACECLEMESISENQNLICQYQALNLGPCAGQTQNWNGPLTLMRKILVFSYSGLVVAMLKAIVDGVALGQLKQVLQGSESSAE